MTRDHSHRAWRTHNRCGGALPEWQKEGLADADAEQRKQSAARCAAIQRMAIEKAIIEQPRRGCQVRRGERREAAQPAARLQQARTAASRIGSERNILQRFPVTAIFIRRHRAATPTHNIGQQGKMKMPGPLLFSARTISARMVSRDMRQLRDLLVVSG